MRAGTVRLLDLMFVHKDADGVVGSIELGEIYGQCGSELVDASGAAGGPACAGKRRQGRRRVGQPGESICWENTWAAPFVSALAASGAGVIDRPGSLGTPCCPRWPRHRRTEETTMGLLGMMARTAVVAGTATAVAGRVSRLQANRFAQNDQERAQSEQQEDQQQQDDEPERPAAQDDAPATPAAHPSLGDQIKHLGHLKAQCLLSDEEFTAAKAKVLGI
ncbi:MAG TPA: SHOCT domain-containing protein [Nakamurella sp.]